MKNNIDPSQLCLFSHCGMVTERERAFQAAETGLTDKPLLGSYVI